MYIGGRRGTLEKARIALQNGEIPLSFHLSRDWTLEVSGAFSAIASSWLSTIVANIKCGICRWPHAQSKSASVEGLVIEIKKLALKSIDD